MELSASMTCAPSWQRADRMSDMGFTPSAVRLTELGLISACRHGKVESIIRNHLRDPGRCIGAGG